LDYLSRYFKEFMRPMPLTFSSSSFFFFPTSENTFIH